LRGDSVGFGRPFLAAHLDNRQCAKNGAHKLTAVAMTTTSLQMLKTDFINHSQMQQDMDLRHALLFNVFLPKLKIPPHN
jgi:hypothetical protein